MNILAIGAHHDDIEIGAGGTLAKLSRQGNKVYGLTLTNSETHYEPANIHRTKKEALEEAEVAAKIIEFEIIPTPRELAADNGELKYTAKYMRFIEDIIKKNKVELVFCHWLYDMNTDHKEASNLSIVASRHINNILMFRSNWYQPDRPFNPIFFSDISKTVDVKKKALFSYKVEIKNRGEDWLNSFIDYNRSLGYSLGVKYAEVFEPVRYLI